MPVGHKEQLFNWNSELRIQIGPKMLGFVKVTENQDQKINSQIDI